MSEAFFDPSVAAGAARGPSAGTLLRQAREAAGLHVAALAVSMKVPVRRLEALEADRWDELPDAVFIRALAASVCRTLKIDPAPVLERLPQVAQRVVEDRPGINQPFHDPRTGGSGGLFTEMSRPLLGAIVALVVAAALIAAQPIWGPWMAERGRSGGSGNGGDNPVATLPAATPAPIAVASVSRSETAAAEPSAGMAGAASGAVPTAGPAPGVSAPVAASLPAPAAASTPAAAGPAVPVPVAPAVTAAATPAASRAASAAVAPDASATLPSAPGVYVRAASAPSGGQPPELVSVRVSAEVWVSITDGKGQSLIRRTVQPGEAIAASGALPLFVVVGRVQSAQVQVRGKAFDVVGIAKDNVARFEVR